MFLDNKKPTLHCPFDMETLPSPGESTGVLEYKIPKASDNVDSNLDVTCDPPPGSILKNKKTRVTCDTKDRAGNEEICSFVVTLNKPKKTTVQGS